MEFETHYKYIEDTHLHCTHSKLQNVYTEQSSQQQYFADVKLYVICNLLLSASTHTYAYTEQWNRKKKQKMKAKKMVKRERNAKDCTRKWQSGARMKMKII